MQAQAGTEISCETGIWKGLTKQLFLDKFLLKFSGWCLKFVSSNIKNHIKIRLVATLRRCESPCKRNVELILSFLSCTLDESTMVEYCRRTPLIRDIVWWKQCWGSGIFTPRSGIRDGKIRIRDKYPRSATLGCKFHADPEFLVNAVLDTGFWRLKIVKFYSRRNAFLIPSSALERKPPEAVPY